MSNSPTDAHNAMGADTNKPGLMDIATRAFVPQISSLFALAAALTIGIGLIMWASKPDYAPIYDKLGQQDAARITEVMRAQNIPYQLEPGTGLVTVPADRLDEVRIKLAAEGLPQSGNVGIEVLQAEQGLGTSRFIENARYQHALETELSRTISSMRNVETARVHLAMPKQSVFIRKQAKASASVMVKMFPGRALENGQVTAIVNLVASSIPYLEASQVTIVDQWGRLLSSGSEQGNGMMETSRQFEYARQLEALYSRRIEDLLSPILGPGRIRAEVNADIDFSIQESTQELFEPDEAQIRSEQSNEQITQGAAGAAGIPGALTNQPPAAGTVDPNAAGGAEGGAPSSQSTQATRNYELDKTITHTKAASGQVQRLSVAVLVDNATTTNEAGETVSTPLTEEEIQQFTALVKQSIGFDEARGDSVVVMNRAFQPVAPIEPMPEPSLLEQPWIWSMGKQLIAGLGVLLLIFWLIRPAMKNLKAAKQQALVAATPPVDPATAAAEQQENQEGITAQNEGTSAESTNKNGANADSKDGTPQLPAPPEVYGDILNMARVLADEDPKRVAKLMKNWVGESNDG